MSTNIIIIGTIIMVIVLGFFVISPLLISRRWKQHKASTVLQWEADGVNFRRGPVGGKFSGLESTKVSRVVPGVGCIALTDKDLRVTRVTPFGVWIVTYKQIKGVTMRWTFRGNRAKKTPFIIARYVKEGQADRLGFQVNEPEAWAEALAEAAGVTVKYELEEKHD